MYGLMTIESYAARHRGEAALPAERLHELVRSGHLPHALLDGKPFIREKEVTEWIRDNLVKDSPGMSYPKSIVVIQDMPAARRVPRTLLPMAESLHMLPEPFYPAGIYFLAKGDSVVYVGQSIGPVARIVSHRNEGSKDFDYALFLPVPRDRLDEVEGAFIRILRPTLNSGFPYPRTGKELEVLAEYGMAANAA